MLPLGIWVAFFSEWSAYEYDRCGQVDVLTKDMVVFHTAGIVTLTIVINGTTAGALYGWLDMYPVRTATC